MGLALGGESHVMVPLGMRTRLALFQGFGKSPSFRQRVKHLEIHLMMGRGTFLYTRDLMQSGLGATFLVAAFLNASSTSSIDTCHSSSQLGIFQVTSTALIGVPAGKRVSSSLFKA